MITRHLRWYSVCMTMLPTHLPLLLLSEDFTCTCSILQNNIENQLNVVHTFAETADLSCSFPLSTLADATSTFASIWSTSKQICVECYWQTNQWALLDHWPWFQDREIYRWCPQCHAISSRKKGKDLIKPGLTSSCRISWCLVSNKEASASAWACSCASCLALSSYDIPTL